MRPALLLLLLPLLLPAALAALQESEQVLQSLVPASGLMLSVGLASLTARCPVGGFNHVGGMQPDRPALS